VDSRAYDRQRYFQTAAEEENKSHPRVSDLPKQPSDFGGFNILEKGDSKPSNDNCRGLSYRGLNARLLRSFFIFPCTFLSQKYTFIGLYQNFINKTEDPN